MDILGIGPLEFIFILIIALIVLGPSDMVKAGRTIGRFLRQIVTSPTWRAVTRTSSELRTLPNKQAIPTDFNSDLNQWKEDVSSWTTPPTIGKTAEDTETSSEDPADPDDDTIEEEQS